MNYEKNGWKYIYIKGSPYERGYMYGKACIEEFIEIQKTLNFLMMEAYGLDWSYFITEINKDFYELTKNNFPEFFNEMEGIVSGLKSNSKIDTSIEEIIAWNFYCSIPYWYSLKSDSHFAKEGGAKDHCSAFMAVGKDWTENGEIVCAHNSFSDFIDGQFSNIVLDINPSDGHRIIMQTSPCWIWSGTDFFITSKGIIGTETTIGGFVPYVKKYPIGYRIRYAMQYGNSLDEYCSILLNENSGDYANSWLFGDINSNEILRIELGLKYHNIERTKNGYFIGFNSTYDERIRNLEVVNSGFYDIRRHQGARMVRLEELMDQHKGKINIEIAKQIIADHYDVYLLKENPCSRTVCSHYEIDAREYMSQSDRPKPFAPHGAVDGIVCDSFHAKNMSFVGRFGNSCGTPFVVENYAKLNRQYSKFIPYLKDRPSQPWTELKSKLKNDILLFKNKSKNNKKKISKRKISKRKISKQKTSKQKTSKGKSKSKTAKNKINNKNKFKK